MEAKNNRKTYKRSSSSNDAPLTVPQSATSTPKRINNNRVKPPLTPQPPHLERQPRSFHDNSLLSRSQHYTAKRVYRGALENKLVTREIASLDFLLNVPLGNEANIVVQGWNQMVQKGTNHHTLSDDDGLDQRHHHHPTPKGTWWEKYVADRPRMTPTNETHNDGASNSEALERPTQADQHNNNNKTPNNNHLQQHTIYNPFLTYGPGRRLEGVDNRAVRIQVPVTTHHTNTKQRSIARQAALREWELSTAHGLGSDRHPPLLDGRLFFSANSSYPVSVCSIIRYEPKKEEAAIRRRKLEAIGGGGTQFVPPERDWRGISYRALLHREDDDTAEDRTFDRFVRDQESDDGSQNPSDDDSLASLSSEGSDVYVPGILDDPEMVLGRHRNVMVGNYLTGPIVSSTIQFVEPTLLKAELNKQFRERFDGWEPPKGARKYIGARVIEGNYVLIDPTDENDDHAFERRRARQGSVTSLSTAEEDDPAETAMRIPPSLTLSKIRSLKQQALYASVKANLDISTVALSCVYFERLCLDCRVDKSNRRLSFAVCLLLALKLNEPNDGLVMRPEEDRNDGMATRLRGFIRPNKRSGKIFASILSFFTEQWCLSLKRIFAAEFGVFAALGFALHASPSQVSFHYKRLMKTLELNPMEYLDATMYGQWQEALAIEEEHRQRRERLQDARRKRKEEQLLNVIENEVMRRKTERNSSGSEGGEEPVEASMTADREESVKPKKKAVILPTRIKLFNRFALRRSISSDRLHSSDREPEALGPANLHDEVRKRRGSEDGRMVLSPSMPTLQTAESENGEINGAVAIDVHDNEEETSSIGSFKDMDGIIV